MDKPQHIIDPDLVDRLEISGFLEEILIHIRERVAHRQQEIPIAGLRALNSLHQERPIDLSNILRQGKLSLIIEVKRQLPDGFVIFPGRYDPVEITRRFAEAGAQAFSIATDPLYYQGEIHHLTLVKEEINRPVLRRDFVFDEYQVFEARAAGADGVFLLAALMGEHRMRNLISLTQRLRMTAVVEVQDEEELARALVSDPRVIGISNRDVRTFQVDLSRTLRLRKLIPDHIAVVSMGGIRTPEDVAMIADTGADALLVGESLLKEPNAYVAIRELFSLVDADPTDPWESVE
jgi:indole-3-glycerol phosphate synthase